MVQVKLVRVLLLSSALSIAIFASGGETHAASSSPTRSSLKSARSETIRQDINKGLINSSYTFPIVLFKDKEDTVATNLIERVEHRWVSDYIQAVGAMCGLNDSLESQHGKIYSIRLFPITIFEHQSLYSLELEERYNFVRGVYQVSYYTVNINLELNRQVTLTSLFHSRAAAYHVLHIVQRSIMSKYGPPTQANPYGFNQIESYTGFHVVPDGLEFEYLSCTVAACGAGPVTVLVPLSKLPQIRTLSQLPPTVN